MLPSLNDVLTSARVVSLPMVTRFRGITVREALLMEGPLGWTEFSPFVEYEAEEASTWLAAAYANGWGSEGAGNDSRAVDAPLMRDRVWVNATVPAVTADEVATVLRRFPGCRTAKVKVAERGQSLADDVARVQAVRQAMGDEARIRVDANGLWNLDEAEHALHTLAPFDLEYAEQPVATVPELAELRRRLHDWGILIAADESVRKASDPLAVARAGAADVLVLKVQPLGGINAALAIAAEAGLPVVVSSALDTSVGLALGARLAASLPTLGLGAGDAAEDAGAASAGVGTGSVGDAGAARLADIAGATAGVAGAAAGGAGTGTAFAATEFDCGLGTAALLAADVTREPLIPVDGRIPVDRVTPDPALLDRYAASDERRDWWLNRLRNCDTVLRAAAVA